MLRIALDEVELVLCQGGSKGHKLLSRSRFSRVGYIQDKTEAFWLSLNPEQGVLKYGKGSRLQRRTFLQYDYPLEGMSLRFCPAGMSRYFSTLELC